MQPHIRQRMMPRVSILLGAMILVMMLGMAMTAKGEGSGTIYRGADPTRFRSHIEWRTSDYGGGADSPNFKLRRRTLLKIFAQQGETILLGSSAVGVAAPPAIGDIKVFNPGQVTGPIGQEIIPALAGNAAPAQPGGFANGFSCQTQRTAAGGGALGQITTRAQELAGPLPTAGGYTPCTYVAPATGIYNLVFTGPSGDNSNTEPQVSGLLDPAPADFGVAQRTSVTAWDATVRRADGTDARGRLFTYYYAGNTGGNGRPLSGQSFVVTDSGFRYSVSFGGDPFGFVFYVNQLGFLNSDSTPLYRNLMSDPTAVTQDQNQLRELQGDAQLLPPEYPIFLAEPDPLTLAALNIPAQPIAPAVNEFAFRGPPGDNTTDVATGGTFGFTTTQAGVYYVVISRDGVNFDPTDPRNRVFRGVAAAAGPISVTWDGRDAEGTAFPPGDYFARAAIQGGEVHFPFLDVENNLSGGPVIELVNPPDITNDNVGDCPPWQGGCFGAFHDDRGYKTASGALIGTAVNGALCPGNAANPRGFGNPPLVLASDPDGFDTRGTQRSFGFATGGNPASICLANGGFGDKKGLDLWTYYPSNVPQAPLRIVDPTAVTLQSLTATRADGQVVVRWETGIERNTLGFYVLRSDSGTIGDAVRATPALIAAQGSATQGAAYSWADSTANSAGAAYWLQEIELDGSAQLYGPVRPGAAPTGADGRVLLPLVVR